MELDPSEQKHWWYKLKKEYELQERNRKKEEARQARKAFRKLLKQSGIMEHLEEIEDYDSFYNSSEAP